MGSLEAVRVVYIGVIDKMRSMGLYYDSATQPE